ncbi:hypothetical protein ABZU25_11550 [Micromonospora sp. NPDC005215]|uniref:hypothetical protein n=1 Tax=Micromonospora sp. NPDC005215 TaxID=3157024 RepID=UPI0033BEB9E4
MFGTSGALRAGGSGSCSRYVAPAHLLRAVTVVACGEALLPPVVIHTLISEFVTAPAPPASPDPAVDRDLQSIRE